MAPPTPRVAFIHTLDEVMEQEEMPLEAKVEINNVLFMLLPPNTTLRDMEKIAVAWHHDIEQQWADAVRKSS